MLLFYIILLVNIFVFICSVLLKKATNLPVRPETILGQDYVSFCYHLLDSYLVVDVFFLLLILYPLFFKKKWWVKILLMAMGLANLVFYHSIYLSPV